MIALFLLLAAPKPPAIAVLPAVSSKADETYAYAVMLRVQEALEQQPQIRQFHNKVTQAAIDSGRVPVAKLADLAVARDVAKRLGANQVITTMLSTDRKLTLQLVTPQGDVIATVKGPASLSPAVAKLVEGLGALPPINEKAYLEYAECHLLLTRQPVSLRAPVVLDADNRSNAVAHCQQAVALDPMLKQAWGALGFARALVNEREEAEAALAKDKDLTHPYYVMGKFWLLSKFYDGGQAVSFLRDAVKADPGMMIVRGYLGETLNALGRYQEALEVFQAYLQDIPESPWAHVQLGHTLAKLKKHTEAVDASIKAVSLVADDDEARMELASRFIDSGKYADAQKMLETLAKHPDVRGETLLRLGYVHFLQGHLDDAEQYCNMAITRATAAREWRTRGRARYDLAKIALRKANDDKAIDELERAFNEGYRDSSKLTADKDFDKVRTHARFMSLTSRAKPAQIAIPTFASPFAHDATSGEPAMLAHEHGTNKPLQKNMTGVQF